MDVAGRIRRTYEKLPYPQVRSGGALRLTWRLPPMDWIATMIEPAAPAPRRILVAGCGTGSEAFVLQRKFPRAKIVGVDFSPHAIELARKSQRHATKCPTRIRFVVGDLTSRPVAKEIGRDFDFITCHGVLSYIPNIARALANLARLLAPGGALYLGVNGPSHFSVAWRRVLAAEGHDLDRFEDSPKLRGLLKLYDALAGHPPGQIAKQDATYLASDLFGALNRALPLADWNRLARRAGLHCWGSFAALNALRPVLNGNLGKQLLPLSRREVAELFDGLSPTAFHYLIYKREVPPTPPWGDPRALWEWFPKLTRLYTHRWPARNAASARMQKVEFRNRSANALVEMRVPAWELKILRHSNGKRSLRQLLDETAVAPPRKTLLAQLYLLHQFAILHLRPPAPGRLAISG